MPQSQPISYDSARARAAENGWREKVFAYVTRRPDELLIFAHAEQYSDAGIQVPAGGVEPDEEPARSVLREAFEESGLRLAHPIYLSSFEALPRPHTQIWHFYWLQTSLDTPDRWDHQVSAGEQDEGMIFRYSFAPRSHSGLITDFDSALDDLDRMITDRA